jgi:hypothetical protein
LPVEKKLLIKLLKLKIKSPLLVGVRYGSNGGCGGVEKNVTTDFGLGWTDEMLASAPKEATHLMNDLPEK